MPPLVARPPARSRTPGYSARSANVHSGVAGRGCGVVWGCGASRARGGRHACGAAVSGNRGAWFSGQIVRRADCVPDRLCDGAGGGGKGEKGACKEAETGGRDERRIIGVSRGRGAG
eukprot:356266-Chlamydomonas_euryale.AAC.3